jgi:hypothetical protein
MKNLLLIATLFMASCTKPDHIQNNPEDIFLHKIGNSLFNLRLISYKGPDSEWKWLYSDSIAALKDDGIRFTAISRL